MSHLLSGSCQASLGPDSSSVGGREAASVCPGPRACSKHGRSVRVQEDIRMRGALPRGEVVEKRPRILPRPTPAASSSTRPFVHKCQWPPSVSSRRGCRSCHSLHLTPRGMITDKTSQGDSVPVHACASRSPQRSRRRCPQALWGHSRRKGSTGPPWWQGWPVLP